MANIRNRRMDDPDGVNCRVFVGNLPLEADRETLKQKFEVHGQVNGVMVLKGFAFIQFDQEPSARRAIERENGSDFGGKKIDVKQAKQNNTNSGGGGGGGGGYQQQNWAEQSRHNSERTMFPSNVRPRGGYNNRGGFGRANFARGGGAGGAGGGGGGGGGAGGAPDGNFHSRGGGGGGSEAAGWGRGFARGGGRGPGRGGGGGGGGGGGYSSQDQFYSEQESEYDEMERYNDRLQADHAMEENSSSRYGGGGWQGHPGHQGPHQHQGPQPPQHQHHLPPPDEKPNDVEIICMDKSIRLYGENIETRLKNMGLSVDILFPNIDIPLGKVIGNIASRGVSYAVCVEPENQSHGSLTLNVLQGEQQEHRNMPVDDAMSFISKNFSSRLEPGRLSSTSSGLTQPVTGSGRHPQDIQKILHFLSDDRALSMMEYDKMIKYLVLRRTELLREEFGDNIPLHLRQPPVGPQLDPASKAKQEELQERIKKILHHKQNLQSSPRLGSASAPNSAFNPSLQAAIDSLVKNGPNLLSNVSNKPFNAGGGFSSSPFQSGSFSQSYQHNQHNSGQGGFTGGFGDY